MNKQTNTTNESTLNLETKRQAAKWLMPTRAIINQWKCTSIHIYIFATQMQNNCERNKLKKCGKWIATRSASKISIATHQQDSKQQWSDGPSWQSTNPFSIKGSIRNLPPMSTWKIRSRRAEKQLNCHKDGRTDRADNQRIHSQPGRSDGSRWRPTNPYSTWKQKYKPRNGWCQRRQS